MTSSSVRPRVPARALLALIALVSFGVAMICGAAPASAHAVLVSSSPVDGSEVAASPVRVTLTFDEPVQLVPGTARVLSSTGVRADSGGATTEAGGTRIAIPLRADLARGSYTVTWRVVSADTHIVAGSITFGVRQPAAAGGSASRAAPVSALDVVAQAGVGLGYLGVILLFGVLVALGRLWPGTPPLRRTRAFLRIGWALLVGGGILQVLLEGPRAAASGWAGVIRFDDLAQTLASPLGVLVAARVLLLVLFAAAARLPARPRAWARSALGAGVLVTIGAAGHAGSGSDVVLAVLAAVLHLAAMAVWLGGVLVLLTVVLPGIRTRTDVDAARLGRWSITAFVSVAVLVMSGEYQAWRQVQPPPALWSTSYGFALLVKLAFVAAALGAALVGQRLVARARSSAAGTDAELVRRLRRSVRWEAVAVSVVLVATTVLTALPPASSTYGPAVQASAPLGSSQRIVAAFDTTHHGPIEITATVQRSDGTSVPAQQLTATLSSTQNGVAAIAVRMRRDGDRWRSVDAVVPLAGAWTLQFDVGLSSAVGYATSVSVRMW